MNATARTLLVLLAMALAAPSSAAGPALVLSLPGTAGAAPPHPELLADLHGSVGAGLVFDDRGRLLVGKDGEVVQITPSGEVSTLCRLKDLPRGKDYYFPSPLVWDMALDKDGNVLAAAQDRILKIAPDGTVTTLVREDFDGFVGASAIELDRAGNMYVPDGGRIWKYSPSLERTLFVDGKNANMKVRPRKGPFRGSEFPLDLKSFVSLEFDPKYENLYVSDFQTKTLLRYPIAPDGTPGRPELLFDAYADDLYDSPLNVIFGEGGKVYVSHDMSSQLLVIDGTGRKDRVPLETIRNHMIAFGGKGFDPESIYFTTLDAKVYRIRIGEKAASRRP